MDKIEYITVDKDVHDFLKVIYFGALTAPLRTCAERAYRDLNRTIRFKNMPQEKRDALRQATIDLLEKEIPDLVQTGVSDQDEYDQWHFRICSKIREIYCNDGVSFYYGQAQKWLNMTMKYLYVCGEYSFDGFFEYLHIPVDNYVFSVAKRELGVQPPIESWSRWDDYEGQYISYQKSLRENINGCSPLRWEFRYWMEEARRLEVQG